MTKQLENTRVSDEINAPLVVSKSRLEGSVIVSGAKNSALRLLAASILTDEPVELSGFPNGLLDVKVHFGMLEKLGKQIQLLPDFVKITESVDKS